MPTGYTLSVPDLTKLAVDEKRSVVVSIAGPGPITLNRPNIPDDYMNVRFIVNPQLVEVTGVELLQALDHNAAGDLTVSGFTWTGRRDEWPAGATKRTFVAYEWFFEDTTLSPEKPFDIVMGELLRINLRGKAAGNSKLTLESARFGEFDTGTAVTEGAIVTV